MRRSLWIAQRLSVSGGSALKEKSLSQHHIQEENGLSSGQGGTHVRFWVPRTGPSMMEYRQSIVQLLATEGIRAGPVLPRPFGGKGSLRKGIEVAGFCSGFPARLTAP